MTTYEEQALKCRSLLWDKDSTSHGALLWATAILPSCSF